MHIKVLIQIDDDDFRRFCIDVLRYLYNENEFAVSFSRGLGNISVDFAEVKPDLSIVYIFKLPIAYDLRPILNILEIDPSAKIIGVSKHNEREAAAAVERAGARGYLFEGASFDLAQKMIEGAAEGRNMFDELLFAGDSPAFRRAKGITRDYVRLGVEPADRGFWQEWLEKAPTAQMDEVLDEFDVPFWKPRRNVQPSSKWVRGMEAKIEEAENNRGLGDDTNFSHGWKGNDWMIAATIIGLLSFITYFAWFFSVYRYKHLAETHSNDIKTLIAPIGQQRQILLADETKVWLNFGSELRYSDLDNGNDRMVQLTGEAYFQIKNESSRPFRVKAGSLIVDALGTAFDLRAYPEDSTYKLSVSEGSVKLQCDHQETILHTGQQATIQVSATGSLPIIEEDIGSDYAALWMKKVYQFRNDDWNTILHGLSRAYNVNFWIKSPLPTRHAFCTFTSAQSVDDVVRRLEYYGVHVKPYGVIIHQQ